MGDYLYACRIIADVSSDKSDTIFFPSMESPPLAAITPSCRNLQLSCQHLFCLEPHLILLSAQDINLSCTAIPLSQPSANASSRRLQLPHAAAYKTTLVPLLCCRPVADLRFGRSNVQKCRLLHICCRKSTPPPIPPFKCDKCKGGKKGSN